jgi:antirestriction protein ArdC
VDTFWHAGRQARDAQRSEKAPRVPARSPAASPKIRSKREMAAESIGGHSTLTAREELRAELSSAFIAAELGIPSELPGMRATAKVG